MAKRPKRPFNDILRLAMLIRIYRYERDNGELPSISLIGRWYGVYPKAIENQLEHLRDAGWIHWNSSSSWWLSEHGRERARREQSKRRTLFSEVLDTVCEEGPGVVGFIDVDGLIRIWIGDEAKRGGLPEATYSMQLLENVAGPLVHCFEDTINRGGRNVTGWTVNGRFYEVWMTRLDPDDPDQGVVLRVR